MQSLPQLSVLTHVFIIFMRRCQQIRLSDGLRSEEELEIACGVLFTFSNGCTRIRLAARDL